MGNALTYEAMNPSLEAELTRRLGMPHSEDNWAERKINAKDERDIKRTLVAFANSVNEGQIAVLFIGATDKGDHPGVSDPDEAQMKVQSIAKGCYPEIVCQGLVLPLERNGEVVRILAIMVPYSQNRPHFGGGAYIRDLSSNREASREQFLELVASQNDKARKILQFKGQWVALRWESPAGLYLDDDAFIERCDAHSVQIKDSISCLWAVSLSKVDIQHDSFKKIKLVAQTQWTEKEQIRRILRHYCQGRAVTGPNSQVNWNDYRVAQLLLHPELCLPVVASEADGSTHHALKTILVAIKFELKKIAVQKPKAQKERELLQVYHKHIQRAGFPSPVAILGAAKDAILQVSTSFDEIQEFTNYLYRHDSNICSVSRETLGAAISWDLGAEVIL